MMRILVISVLAVLAGCASRPDSLPTQSGVDLSRYEGTWYELARLPNRFQKHCEGDVRANYALQADGTIAVTNQCRQEDGTTKVANGVGRLAGPADEQDPARLEVRFAPQWTAWLPMVWGDYWIIRLHDGYQYSLVGTPDRKYLWVLSRDRQGDEAVVNELLAYARTLGFAVDEVIRTPD